ncbi:MAG: CHAT domain-containing protein [Crocinitomicaceae bacterium]|nr:CHAT domain-containing protein [Crocinitomicaceae bacterium]
MNRLLFALILLLASSSYAQKYANKKQYLVDKLEYNELSETSKTIVDHYIGYYHAYTDELWKVSAIYELIRNCWDEKVWPQYNDWMRSTTNEILKRDNLADSLRFTYNQFNIGTYYYEGWGHFGNGDYYKAIASFQYCYDRYIEIEDPQGAANAIDNIGSMYSTLGELAIALEYHVQGLKIREEIHDTLGLGASWNAIGIVHMSHGDYFQAIEDLEKSADFHMKAGYMAGVATAYSNLGSILSSLQDYPQSMEFHIEAYKIREALEDKHGMILSLNALTPICIMAEDTALAIDYVNYQYQLAEEIGDKRGIAGAYTESAHIYFLKDKYEEGEKQAREAIKIAEEIGDQNLLRASLQELFLGYLYWGKYDKADPIVTQLINMRHRDIKINFAILAEQQKEMYFNTMEGEFQNLYAYGHLVVEQNPEITIRLYDNTLLLKGLLLQSTSAMREAILSSNDAKLIEQYDKWIDLKTQIADAYAKGLDTEQLEKDASTLEQELVKSSSAFNAFQTGKMRSWKDVQARLNENEAAIEFIRYPLEIGNDYSPMVYSALVIKKDSKTPELIDICMEEDLQNVLGKVRTNDITFVNEVYGKKEGADQEISKLIWEPLKGSMDDISKIYFAPDGLMHKVAFSAIKIADDKFMSDQFELVQMGSTAELLSDDKFEISGETVATLFGGVKYSTDSSEHVIWNYLPGSLEEIDSIKSIISKDMKVNYFVGNDASEGNFKQSANSSNILHIASHGFFYPDPEVIRQEVKVEMDETDLAFRGGSSNYGIWNFVNNENPLMRSGLALAAANDAWQRDVFAKGEDGVLSAQEVSNLNMSNTELVVLSACETGLGDIKGSEGVYGLQRAFKMAGVRYLIMSLWQVPDAETAEFMTLFYENLFQLKDIRGAFSKAQAEMRAKYDPYFWAAFVLIE